MNNKLPDDAMTFGVLQDYEAKRSGVIKRGYSIGEVDELFGRAVYILKMYEEGSSIDPRMTAMTAKLVSEHKFARNNNGYNMKEIDRIVDRIVLALKYWEANNNKIEFGLDERKPKFRKVQINGQITEMDITDFTDEELENVVIIDEPEDTEAPKGFFGATAGDVSNDLLEENDYEDDVDLAGYMEDASSSEEGPGTVEELEEIEEDSQEDSLTGLDGVDEAEEDEEDDDALPPTEEDYVAPAEEEEEVEEEAPSDLVFTKMKSSRARTADAYENEVVSLPADWKTYAQR